MYIHMYKEIRFLAWPCFLLNCRHSIHMATGVDFSESVAAESVHMYVSIENEKLYSTRQMQS